MNSNNVTSHEILDPKKRPNDANELWLFSDTSINNETHSNESYILGWSQGRFSSFRYFVIPNSPCRRCAVGFCLAGKLWYRKSVLPGTGAG